MSRPERYVVILAALCGCYGGLDQGVETDGGSGGISATAPGSGPGSDTAEETEGDDGSSTGDDPDDEPPVECGGEVLDPGPNLVRRLTVDEYANTVEALLEVDIRSEAVATLPAELRADGFSNTASGLISTLGHVEGYDELGELAVSRIPSLANFASTYTDCVTFTPECESAFVRNFGRRAYRRPLRDDEVDLLASVFDAAEVEGDPFEVGAGLVVEAMLQSPPFLFRVEDETSGNVARELGGFDLATRMSYLLWAGPPDDPLLDAAEADALRTEDEIIEQVDRMLADPQARNASKAFLADWLHLARLDVVQRDPAHFPDWSPEIAAAMKEETRSYFESIAWDQDRPLSELFNAQEAWLTPELATHYGLTELGEGSMLYDVSTIPERGGLLTQGSLLTLGGDEASMVGRGQFVLETLLCGDLDSPPADVDTTPPMPEPGKSQRFYSEERTTNPTCAGCHVQMEPFAWGIERYLADGTHAIEDALGNPLREDGYVVFPGDPESYDFSNSEQMMTIIAEHPKTAECMALKGNQFAIGRKSVPTDDCSIEALQQRLAESGGTWRDLVVAIALSPGFRNIRVEE